MMPTTRPDTLLANRFVIVLNETQDIVNIAGAARAMLNTGLWRLRLVRPALFDAYRITGMAHGSENLLQDVEFFDTLDAALADTTYILGTTARRRTASYVWQHPREAAPDLITFAADQGGPIAIVFGKEDSGLPNEALDLCNRLLVIPTNPAHASLNLAHAVLLVGYELWLAAEAERKPGLPEPKRRSSAAKPQDLRLLFEDTQRSLAAIEFFKSRNQEAVMRTIRAIARKANLSVREAKLMRAVAIEVRKFLERR